MRLLKTLSVTLAAATFSGCAVTTTALNTKSEVTVKRSLQDVTAARAIRARMVRASDHDLNDISVDVVQGIVVLAGATPKAESKKEAERIAWSAPGVTKVGNEIYVGRSSGFARKTKDDIIDTAIRTKLASSNDVRNLNYTIETRDGVVYLLGVARSESELKEAARLASITKGVKEVVSYVTVKGDISNAYGGGYSGGSVAAPSVAYTGQAIPSTRYTGTPYGQPAAPSVSADEDMSFWGTPVAGAQDIYGGGQTAALPDAMPYSAPIDPSAPLPYRPGSTELDADAIDSGEPFLRDPYTGEKIELPEGVKPLPYIPPGPGSLGEGALPLPPGAEAKIAQMAPAIPAPAMSAPPVSAPPLASPYDPGPVNDVGDGPSVRITKPYTIDPNTGEKINVSWDGKQWVGVVR